MLASAQGGCVFSWAGGPEPAGRERAPPHAHWLHGCGGATRYASGRRARELQSLLPDHCMAIAAAASYCCCLTHAGKGVDQLAELIHKIKTNPNDRRLVLTAWNPAALKEMALPPCHMFCQASCGFGGVCCLLAGRVRRRPARASCQASSAGAESCAGMWLLHADSLRWLEAGKGPCRPAMCACCLLACPPL